MRMIHVLILLLVLAGEAVASGAPKTRNDWLAMLAQAETLSELCPEHPKVNRLVFRNVLLNHDIPENGETDAYIRVGKLVLKENWREFSGEDLCLYARLHFGPDGQTHPWLLMFD